MLGLGFTSCDDQDDAKYTPTTPEESPEAYFSPAAATSVELQETDTQFTVSVYRATKEGALTVPVTCTASAPGLFTIPESVDFADGSDVADLVVTFNTSNLQGGIDYTFDFVLGEGVDTPYALEKLSYTAVYFPWVDLVGPNGETQGVWVDDMICKWYSLPSGLSWPVAIQSSPAIEGLYRVVNPYEYLAANVGGVSYDSSTPHYFYFNAKDPNAVFICDKTGNPLNADGSIVIFTSGMTLGSDGFWQLSGKYNLALYGDEPNPEAAAKAAGTLVNGVLKFPASSIMIGESEYNGGLEALQGAWANESGAFRVIFPGCKDEEEPEPAEWESRGTADFTDPWYYPLYQVAEPQTWEVAVEENAANPGVFRLVNPYKEGVCPDGPNYDGDKYMVIDCADANCVLIEPQYLGIDRDEDGEHRYFGNSGGIFTSLAGVTNSWVIEKGWNDLYDAAANKVTIAPANVGIMYCENEAEMEAGKIYSPLEEYAVEGVIVFKGEAAAAAKAARSSMNYLPTLKSALRILGVAKKITDFSGKHNNSKKLLKRGARAVKRSFK